MTTDFLTKARNTYDGAMKIESDKVSANYLKAAQVAALVSIAGSLAKLAALTDKEDDGPGTALSASYLLGRIDALDNQVDHLTARSAPLVERIDELEAIADNLIHRLEMAESIIEDLAGFDADEVEPDDGCHVCGEPAHHFNTFTGGRFCRECFGLITLAAGGAIEVAASGQQVCGRCRDTVYMYSVEAGQWLCRRHFDEVANAS